jgi:hypothetical protein
MVATALCCPPSNRAQGAISRATQNSSSGRAYGCAGLIKPPVGRGLAYVDWSQQELGIAAALSADQVMMDAYRSGDPYLAFAKQAGAVPPDATKHSHSAKGAASTSWKQESPWPLSLLGVPISRADSFGVSSRLMPSLHGHNRGYYCLGNADVRFGSLADIVQRPRHVCFTPSKMG